MYRRALLSLPFLAPLALAVGIKPDAKVAARKLMREIGVPDGWRPRGIAGRYLFEGRASDGSLQAWAGFAIRKINEPPPRRPSGVIPNSEYIKISDRRLAALGGWRSLEERLRAATETLSA